MPVREFGTKNFLGYDEDGNELWSNENAVLLSWSNPDNQDSDGDGLMDGNELQVTTRFDGHTYTKMYSNPCLADTDGDGLDDYEDENPVVFDICVLSDKDADYVLFNTGNKWEKVNCTAKDYCISLSNFVSGASGLSSVTSEDHGRILQNIS